MFVYVPSLGRVLEGEESKIREKTKGVIFFKVPEGLCALPTNFGLSAQKTEIHFPHGTGFQRNDLSVYYLYSTNEYQSQKSHPLLHYTVLTCGIHSLKKWL